MRIKKTITTTSGDKFNLEEDLASEVSEKEAMEIIKEKQHEMQNALSTHKGSYLYIESVINKTVLINIDNVESVEMTLLK